MEWPVALHEKFAAELLELPTSVRQELAAHVRLLERFGPQLGRPYADTLKGSRYANMKELRFSAAGGVWRAAYVFDPERQAIVLVAGNKVGRSQRRFYRQLIAQADERFADHLERLKRGAG